MPNLGSNINVNTVLLSQGVQAHMEAVLDSIYRFQAQASIATAEDSVLDEGTIQHGGCEQPGLKDLSCHKGQFAADRTGGPLQA